MMDYKNINPLNKISELLELHGDHNEPKNGEDYNYVNESSLDSFALLNFIADIEDIFSIQFSPEELSQTHTHSVKGLVNLIELKKSELK
jgi:acyl carrier protein